MDLWDSCIPHTGSVSGTTQIPNRYPLHRLERGYLQCSAEQGLQRVVAGLLPGTIEESGRMMQGAPGGQGLQAGFLELHLLAVGGRARAFGGEDCWHGEVAGGVDWEASVSAGGKGQCISTIATLSHHLTPHK